MHSYLAIRSTACLRSCPVIRGAAGLRSYQIISGTSYPWRGWPVLSPDCPWLSVVWPAYAVTGYACTAGLRSYPVIRFPASLRGMASLRSYRVIRSMASLRSYPVIHGTAGLYS